MFILNMLQASPETCGLGFQGSMGQLNCSPCPIQAMPAHQHQIHP